MNDRCTLIWASRVNRLTEKKKKKSTDRSWSYAGSRHVLFANVKQFFFFGTRCTSSWRRQPRAIFDYRVSVSGSIKGFALSQMKSTRFSVRSSFFILLFFPVLSENSERRSLYRFPVPEGRCGGRRRANVLNLAPRVLARHAHKK